MSNDTKEFKGAFIADPLDNTKPKSLSEVSIDWKAFQEDLTVDITTKNKKFEIISQIPYRVMVNAAKIVVKCKDGEDYVVKDSKEFKNDVKLGVSNILFILDDIESITDSKVIIFEKDLGAIYGFYLSYIMNRTLESIKLNVDDIKPILGATHEINRNLSRAPMLSMHLENDLDFSNLYPNLEFPEGLPSRRESKHDKRVRNRQKLYNKRKRLGRKL